MLSRLNNINNRFARNYMNGGETKKEAKFFTKNLAPSGG